ncbi:hypothetical protein DTO271G3_7272 [Paecilomyces variotii]|nr:hypothetical protein DTO271G3_7272 [Paecilomyces variotii]
MDQRLCLDWNLLPSSKFPQECLNSEQTYFNQSASRTFRYTPKLYPSRTWDPNHFFPNEPALVHCATDYFTVGSESKRIVLQTSDFTFNLTDFAYPFAGIYGLSPLLKGDNVDEKEIQWYRNEVFLNNIDFIYDPALLPRNYVEKIYNSTCVLNVRTVGNDTQFLGNFGEKFAKDKYIIFDWEKLAVGLADIQWSNVLV